MSGGVDSSVAALLMKKQGYECIGCTMKLYDNEDAGLPPERSCCSSDDVQDARSVAARLGMPFYVFNFKDEFREKVIGRFVESYLNGLTPNPCIDCNRCMKFGKLFERADQLGCDVIATGHYARVEEKNGRWQLLRSGNSAKDQSYVLACLTQEQLARVRFPLEGLSKDEVRAIAAENGFFNASKPDSQDICFVPDGRYAKVVEAFSGKKPEPGPYLDTEGRVIGTHKGIIYYTIGQHKKLGISTEVPLYVKEIRPEENAVVLCTNEELFSREVYVQNMNWIPGEAPAEPFRCEAKIRYRHAASPATVYPTEKTAARIVFDEAQRAVTPGQAAVLYDGDAVLGGGEIIKKP